MYSVSARAKGAFARKNKMAQGCVGECRLEVGGLARYWSSLVVWWLYILGIRIGEPINLQGEERES